jgi:HTH-type transcriptional regulator / antitoxin HigA
MSSTTNQFLPDYAIHPGEYLEEVLLSRDIAKNDFAARCGIATKTVSQIIHGHASFSPEVAIQFERVLGISAEIWTGMLSSYQLQESRRQEQERLNLWAEWADQFPLPDMRRLGILKRKDSEGRWVKKILEFFGVSSPDSWETVYGQPAAAYRKSKTLAASTYALATWIRLAEAQAENIETEPFDENSFREAVETVRSLTRERPEVFEPEIRRLCSAAGVAVVFVPEVTGARVSGATKWLSSSKAMVAGSLRHKSDDHFWFTLFHEFGHVILHGKKRVFVDDEVEGDSEEEQEADRFARSRLVPKRAYSEFLAQGSFFAGEIAEFADKINVAPGIVVGMLQHDRKIEYSWHNGLKRTLDFEKTRNGRPHRRKHERSSGG